MMKTKIRKYLYNEFYFKYSFIMLTILYCIPTFMPIIDNIINIFFLWMALIVINDLYTTQSTFKFKGSPLAYMFLGVFICTIIAWSFEIIDIKVFIYMYMQLCFFVSVNRKKGLEEIKGELKKIRTGVVYLGTILCIVSLVLYFIGYCEVYHNNVMSMELLVGRHPNSSLYGVLGNSNWMSFLCITIIGLSDWLQSFGVKKRYYVSGVIALITLYLTNSRGGFVGVIVLCSVIYIIKFCIILIKEKYFSIKAFLLIPLCVIVLISANSITKNVSGRLYNCIKNVEEIKSSNEKNMEISKSIERSEEEQQGSTNIRLELLKAGAKVVKRDYLVGVGVAHLKEKIYDEIPENSLVNMELAGNTHNVYMQTAVASGAIGIILFVSFIAYIMLYSIVVVLKKYSNINNSLSILIALIFAYLVVNLVEADIFISRNFMSSLFWIILGYLARMSQLLGRVNKTRKEEIEGELAALK